MRMIGCGVWLAAVSALAACNGSESPAKPSDHQAPPPATHVVQVTRAGDGSGTVRSEPAAIDCGSSCTASLDDGTTVTLVATADSESTFDGWSGACTGTDACQLVLTADAAVTATFAHETPPPPPPPSPPPPVKRYTLAVATSGGGAGTVTSTPAGIACGQTCSATFDAGAKVSLVAAAASGSRFAGWSGACGGTGTCEVTLSGDAQVTATFEASPPPPSGWAVTRIEVGDGAEGVIDLNDRGDVLGWYRFSPDNVTLVDREFLWHGASGDVTWLDDWLDGSANEGAVAINDSGDLVLDDFNPPVHTAVWSDGTLTPIDSDLELAGLDLGNQGWVVGATRDGTAFVWDGQTVTTLGPGTAKHVNGAGVIVGEQDGRAVRFANGDVIDLPIAPAATIATLTEGGLVYGTSDLGNRNSTGIVVDLATGAATRLDPPDDAVGLWLIGGNDRGEAVALVGLNHDAGSDLELWADGKWTPLSALAKLPLTIQTVVGPNARGQLAVAGWDGKHRTIAVLTPPK